MSQTSLLSLRALFEQQQRLIQLFFEQMDLAQVEALVETCLQCKGNIVLTGVGKSGIIAEKIAMTLLSTGTNARYLSAANALHGDIGIFSKEDLVLLFSKSGESEELLLLIPHLKRKGCAIVAVVSDEESRLARSADRTIYLPVERELCPYDLAPTTSAVVQLLFGDLLAIALMEQKQFSLAQYAENHPLGLIGRKLTIRVKDVMRKEEQIPLCGPEDRLFEVIVELSNKKCGCLLVVDKEKNLLGIFTDGDLRRCLQQEGVDVMQKQMAHLMTPNPISVSADELSIEVLKKMQKKRFVMMAPVLFDKRVIGLVHMHDIIHQGIL